MLLVQLYSALCKRLFAWHYRRVLKEFGSNSVIWKPLRISGNISVGSNVTIQYKSWLQANPLTGENAYLEIGEGCVIGHFNEIYATKSIVLEPNVLTADRVYISDNLHGYENPDLPVLKQPVIQNGNGVVIGEGSWLGVGVCVLGASIGKHCVVGSNAVVTHDIPDYSVAVGIPAKVIKRYNQERGKWEKTNSDGSFKE